MNWTNKHVVVTGAGGFIGSHLVERLVELGARVKAFVHYNALGNYGWLDESAYKNEIEVIVGDIRDRDSVQYALANTEVVFHLAALIAIPYSYRAPQSYIETNINGTLNILQAAREHNIECVIHTSTSEVYGTALYTPIDEKHPLQGQSPYSASKIGADKMVEAFHRSFDAPVVTIRPFNTFGPRQSARAVIPTIITQCLTHDSIKLGSLHPLRDLNFVSNTVDGFILAASTPLAIGKTINIGSGQEISVGNLAHKIASLLGKTIQIETDEQRLRPENSEVDRLLADISYAKELLGWSPKISLEHGLMRTIEWLKEHLERYRPNVYTI